MPHPAVATLDPSSPAPRGDAARRLLARSFATTKDLLEQLHSVVEGTIQDVRFDMDDCWGPRTVLTLSDVRSLLGAPHPSSTLELYTFGGLLPDGSYVEVSELPRYALGARYLLFLRNTDWRYSPVIGDYAYRLERIAGKDTLISTSGRAVTGLTDEGVETHTGSITDPVGLRVKGLAASFRDALDPAHGKGTGQCGGQESGAAGCDESHVDPYAQARAAEEARRRIILTERFAKPAVVPGVDEKTVAAAIGAVELVHQLEGQLERTQIRPGGRFLDRPRYGCWSSTPTVREGSQHAEVHAH